MQRIFGLAAAAALFVACSQASAAMVTFDFENITDQGFGHKFGNDASKAFPITNIGGSHRMEVLRNGDFQEADRPTPAATLFSLR